MIAAVIARCKARRYAERWSWTLYYRPVPRIPGYVAVPWSTSCDSLAEARWHGFATGWIIIGAAMRDLDDRAVGDLITLAPWWCDGYWNGPPSVFDDAARAHLARGAS